MAFRTGPTMLPQLSSQFLCNKKHPILLEDVCADFGTTTGGQDHQYQSQYPTLKTFVSGHASEHHSMYCLPHLITVRISRTVFAHFLQERKTNWIWLILASKKSGVEATDVISFPHTILTGTLLSPHKTAWNLPGWCYPVWIPSAMKTPMTMLLRDPSQKLPVLVDDQTSGCQQEGVIWNCQGLEAMRHQLIQGI